MNVSEPTEQVNKRGGTAQPHEVFSGRMSHVLFSKVAKQHSCVKANLHVSYNTSHITGVVCPCILM